METGVGSTTEFAQRMKIFLKALRDSPSGKESDELKQTKKELIGWLAEIPAVASRPTIKVKASVGQQGKRTHTPWIALLDKRETTTVQEGRYIIFFITKDLSATYLTLNQAVEKWSGGRSESYPETELKRIAEEARLWVGPRLHPDFQQDNDIDLKANTPRAKKFEKGTIAYVVLPNDQFPSDETILEYLVSLLEAYDRLIESTTSQEDDPPKPVLKPTGLSPYSMEDALKDLFLDPSDIERYLAIWSAKKNLILQGSPGVGKTFVARRLAYALIGFADTTKVQMVQFHQSYSYEDFVQGYRPAGNGGFVRKNGIFLEFRNRAASDRESKFVLIIDEINRGNLSKILGELMLLIEPDKRCRDWASKLSYADEDDDDFYVPDNLYLLGLMNTADRSLSIVDYALRRRFAFVSMKPAFNNPVFPEYLRGKQVTDDICDKIVDQMNQLNREIEQDRTNLGPGFCIGHSFFTPNEPVEDSQAWYLRVVETEIAPLLEEYWFDDPDKADSWCEQLIG